MIHKQVLGFALESHFRQLALHVVNKLLGHQVDTRHLVFILHPQMVLLVEVQMIVTQVFGQFHGVPCQRVDMVERRTVVEVDMAYRTDDHTPRLRADNDLRTVIGEPVRRVVLAEQPF